MRILHTSDWHLGRSFHGMSLHDLSARLLRELVQTVEQEQIDVLLVSGDVYDQAQPRTETVALLSQTLEELSATGVCVVLTSGNHDSAPRLGFGARLMQRADVHIVTDPDAVGEPVMISRGQQKIAVYGIPYLEPRAVSARYGVQPSHSAVLTYAMEKITSDLAERDVTASVVLAHCFARGGSASDSERDLQVGGLNTVSTDVFSGVDYVALGHLHGRQSISERVRYSGSLLPFSFSEENHRKGAWIIDIDDDGGLDIREHHWQTRLTLKTLRGTLQELLTDPVYQPETGAVYRIYLTDEQRPLGAIEKLRERFETVAELFFTPAQQKTAQKEESYSKRLGQKKPLEDVTHEFFTHVRGRQPEAQEEDYLRGIARRAREEKQAE